VRIEECGLRPIEEGDLATVLEWRNSERIRANMYTDHLISREEHRAGFAKVNAWWWRDLGSDPRFQSLIAGGG